MTVLRKLGPLFLAILAAFGITSILLLPQAAYAKTNVPTNTYGPGNVLITQHCPSMQSVVTLTMTSQLQSITLSGNVTGGVLLKDTAGNINKIVSGQYSFTTVATDELDACVIGGGNVTLTDHGQLNWYSGVWAGYGVNGFNSSPNTYTSIVGSWSVPSVSCAHSLFVENSQSSTWIGFGGLPNAGAAQMIEQMGTIQACSYGFPKYIGVYENYPAAPVAITSGCSDTNHQSCNSVPANVKAGDSITVKISYVGNGIFQMQEYDFTQHWWITLGESQSNSSTVSLRYTAEWIEEAPPPNKLSNFGQVNFSGCAVDGNPILSAGPIVQNIAMKHNGGAFMAQPLGLSGNGSNFSILFENH